MQKDIDVIVLNSHGVGQVCNIKRLPYLGESLRAWNWRVEDDGGKGTNVAIVLGRLGVKVAYIGKVGKDPWGDLGFKWMGEAGVDTSYMYQDENVTTGTGLVMIDEQGRNTIVDGESSLEALTVEEIQAGLEAMKSAKIFITGFAMPMNLALIGAKMAHDMGMITMCNASPLPNEPIGDLSYIDYLVINEVEAMVMAGMEEDTSKDYAEIARKVHDIYHCGAIILTIGEEGSMVLMEDEIITNPGVKIEVADTTGAGDSYLGAYAANMIWGKSVQECCAFADTYAALKVTRHGTINVFPFLNEIEDFILSLKEK